MLQYRAVIANIGSEVLRMRNITGVMKLIYVETFSCEQVGSATVSRLCNPWFCVGMSQVRMCRARLCREGMYRAHMSLMGVQLP